VFPDFRGANTEVDAIEDRARERLRAQGATLVTVKLPSEFLTLWNAVLSPASEAEFKQEFERYLAARTGQVPKSLEQFISRSEAFRDSAQPVNPKLIEALKSADRDGLKDSKAYRDIVERAVPALKAELKRIFDDNELSALLFSTMSCPASARFDKPDPSYECRAEDPYAAGYIASVTGAPEVSLPAGVVAAGVPVGLSLLGRAGDDMMLLALASIVAPAMAPVSPPVLTRSAPSLH
jgi:amidase